MNIVNSEPLSQPIKEAKTKETRINVPSLNVSKAEYGKIDKINCFMSNLYTSGTNSTVIGIRGNFTNKMEHNPIKVKIKDETIIIKKVQLIVLRTSFDVLNLFTETIAVEKIKGTTRYRPNLINNSVKKERKSAAFALSNGRINAAKIPSTIPIIYFNQTIF